MRKRLGECLVHAGLVTDDDLRAALVEQKRTREHLGVILTRRGLATDLQIATTVAGQLGIPFVRLTDRDADPAVASLIPADLAIERGCVALTLQHHVLTLAMADPLVLGLVHDLESRTGYRVRTVVATASDIGEFIRRAYSTPERDIPPSVPAGEFDDDLRDSDAVLDTLVAQTLLPGIAEVRIEPGEGSGVVSNRVDGRLTPLMTLPRDGHQALIARLKQRACMDPHDRALPQDGRLGVAGGDGHVQTIRVSTRPGPFGELAVLRSRRDEEVTTLPLDALGLWGVSLESLMSVMSAASGLLLISAPAAGGSSTTARSVFDAMGRSGSRALLFGDIHDAEQAGLALTAAREGAIVIATLQAGDTAGAVDRLVGLSWSPGLVAEVLAGVVGQCLAHRLCGECRRPSASLEGYVAAGCAQCGYSGYRGRIGLFEVMHVESRWRHQVAQGGMSLRDAAVAAGMVTLVEDALGKVAAGIVPFGDVPKAASGRESARPTCPACGSVIDATDEGHGICGHCGGRVRAACRSCGRALRPEWGTCPYCSTSVEAGTLLERLS